MTRFVTVAGMKAYEAYLAAGGISYRQMMEEAGRSAAQRIVERWPPKGRRVVVLCGKGNNGGDGFVVARRLAEEGRGVALALHDLCLALARADEIAVLGEGRLLALGEPEEIFQSGMLERVMGVRLERTPGPRGWRYFCELPEEE